MNRRELLKLAAVAPMTSSFRFQDGVGSKKQASELMTKLSSYMAEAGTRKLPEEIVEKTKQVVLDTVTAMISGAELPPGQFAINFARTYEDLRAANVEWEWLTEEWLQTRQSLPAVARERSSLAPVVFSCKSFPPPSSSTSNMLYPCLSVLIRGNKSAPLHLPVFDEFVRNFF